MSYIKFFPLIIIIAFSSISFAQTNFETTNGPEGGKSYDYLNLRNNTTFYATDNGIFVTVSLETIYQPYALQGSSVFKFIKGKNSNLTFILTDHGLYKNKFTGLNKDSLKRVLALSYRDPVTGIIHYPKATDIEIKGDTIVVIADGMIWYSHDNGLSFKQTLTPPATDLSSIYINRKHRFVAAFSTGSNTKFGISDDGGETFTQMDAGLKDHFTSIASTTEHTYGVEDNKIVQADYGDKSWAPFYSDFKVAKIVAEGNELFAWSGDGKNIIKYDETSQKAMNLPELPYSDILFIESLSEDDDYDYLAGTEIGFYHSFGGKNLKWKREIENLAAADVTTIYPDDDYKTLYAGSVNGEIHKTSDGGIKWEIQGELPSAPIDLVKTTNGTLIATAGVNDGFVEDDNGIIYRSTDDGKTWDSIQAGYFEYLTITDSGYIEVTSYSHGVYLSKDDGQTWQQVNSFLSGSSYSVDGIRKFNKKLYAFNYYYIFESTDGGYNWSIIHSVQSNDIAFLDASHRFSASNTGLLKYDTTSKTWENVDTAKFNTKVTRLQVIEDSILVAGLSNGAVYQSNDKGETWSELNEPGILKRIIDIAGYWDNDSARIFIAPNESAVWRNWAMPEVELPLGIENEGYPAKRNSIDLNIYPNPAYDEIKVTFSLPEKQEVQIIIRDVQGRLIKSYNQHPGKGQHTISFGGLQYYKGIYFLSLRTDHEITTRKIVF